MNLLAHAVLSPLDRPGVLAGNMAADWIKGRARLALPTEVREGVELHRRIDAFTDSHVLVNRCAGLLEERWGRYAPVLVDIFFDHVLCTQWERHCDAVREAVIARAYAALETHWHVLPGPPQRAQVAVRAMIAQDWLSAYATLEGIELALSRLSRRLRHEVDLAPAVEDLVRHRDPLGQAFAAFFPLLRCHCA